MKNLISCYAKGDLIVQEKVAEGGSILRSQTRCCSQVISQMAAAIDLYSASAGVRSSMCFFFMFF